MTRPLVLVDPLSENKNPSLHVAVLNGDEALLIDLLNANDMQVTTTNDKGQSPLFLAILCGNVKAAELILQNNKASIECKDSEYGCTEFDLVFRPPFDKLREKSNYASYFLAREQINELFQKYRMSQCLLLLSLPFINVSYKNNVARCKEDVKVNTLFSPFPRTDMCDVQTHL